MLPIVSELVPRFLATQVDAEALKAARTNVPKGEYHVTK